MKNEDDTIAESFFGIKPGDFWKSTRLLICQNSMQLWFALHLVNIDVYRKPTREEEMEAIRSYPYDTGTCRCRNCRYHRLYRKFKI